MITNEKRDEMIKELINWFIFHDLDPADGGLVMIRLMASQFVKHSKDRQDLKEAIKITTALLVLDTVDFLEAPLAASPTVQ